MLYEIEKEFRSDLLESGSGPFISLYQPTHRYSPDNKKDLIVYKKLISGIEKLLEKDYKEKQKEKFMEPFYALRDDREFWENASSGLAVLYNSEKCIVYKLPEPVSEIAMVTDSFYIKPLIRAFQASDRFILLSLSREKFTVYEGNRYEIYELKIPGDKPRTMVEVLGKEITEPYLSHGSYGGAGGLAMYHGHGDKNAEIDKDTERYFNYVDKFVYENYCKNSDKPLILIAPPEHQGEFRKISHNPNLIETGIKHSDNLPDMKKVREMAWEIMEPIYIKKLDEWADRYNSEKSKSLGEDHISKVVKAACEKRISAVLIEAEKTVYGKIDQETCELILGNEGEPGFRDVLDDIAEMVYRDGGNVVILPPEKMPSKTGIAAIIRYYPTYSLES